MRRLSWPGAAVLILRLVCLAVILAAPLVLNAYYVFLMLQITVSAFLALSFDIAYSHARILSFCQGLFFAVSAYVAVYLASPGWWSLAAMLVGGTLAGAASGALVGAILMRMHGHGAIIATVILAAAGLLIGNALSVVTGGDDGISLRTPVIGAFGGSVTTGANPVVYYLAVVPIAALVLGLWRLQGSLAWTVMRAVAMNGVRASQLGFDVGRRRYGMFVASAAIAGFGGALYTLMMGHVTTAVLDIALSLNAILWAVVGGLGSDFGALLGALVILPVTEVVATVFTYVQIFIGLLLVVTAVAFPQGVIGTLKARDEAGRPAADEWSAGALRRVDKMR
jgi:branched-chain amino acid transport system permease protein